MQTSMIARLLTSPPLPVALTDELQRRFAAAGTLLASLSDDDVNVYALSFRSEVTQIAAALAPVFEKIGANNAIGRAFRLDLQLADSDDTLSDEAVRAIAVDVHGALRSPVHIGRRTVPASAWKTLRAMGWGPDGLVAPSSAPTLPYGASESVGVAIEIGPPLVIVKLHLIGASERQIAKILNAVAGQASGFAEVAGYPLAAKRSTDSFAVLECSDLKRTPLARVLRVIEIEGARFGARLGAGTLLSHIPLQSLLDTLAVHTALHAQPAQIIETHLSSLSVPASVP